MNRVSPSLLSVLSKGSRPYWFLFILLSLLCGPTLLTLPVMDRDEALFAQATKQMVETGDYVTIYFQEVPRLKKPVGIYWLQASFVKLLGHPDSIWIYRLPSFFGTLASAWLTFIIGAQLFSRRTALLGAILLASSLMLIIQAVQARVDAVLLATMLLAQLGLAKIYLNKQQNTPFLSGALLFWLGWSFGLLLKGPLVPVVSMLTILSLVIWDRQWRWLKRLRPLLGIPLVLLLVLPWLFAIQQQTEGRFLQESLGKELE
jgi:4-amino-4-deoxy-L-arabinose transferase-like glycosyltransferase